MPGTKKRKASRTSTKKLKKIKQEEDETMYIMKEEELPDLKVEEEEKPKRKKCKNQTPEKKESKNKKKFFSSFAMSSLQFKPEHAELPVSDLLQLTESQGEDFVQYCCLGLFITKDQENPVFILNKRFRNAIITGANVKDVTLYEILYGDKQKINDYYCKIDSGSNYYSAHKSLSATNNGPSKLAWKIVYLDGSFDIHLMKEKSIKTVQNNSEGLYQKFADYFTNTKQYPPNGVEKLERPKKVLITDNLIQEIPGKHFQPSKYDIQKAVETLEQASTEDQVVSIFNLLSNPLVNAQFSKQNGDNILKYLESLLSVHYQPSNSVDNHEESADSDFCFDYL